MPIQLEAAALTDRGIIREINEDTVFQKVLSPTGEDTVGLFIVADGVGGQRAGEAASHYAVESIKINLADLIDYHDPLATGRFSQDALSGLRADTEIDPDGLQQRVLAAVHKANTVIREYARQKLEKAGDAGTTISMALISGRYAVVANVGDSRTYLLRDDQLRQITRDHSLIQRLIEAGYVSDENRYTHPYRNLIFRSLGANDTVEVDTFALTLAPGDSLLLCTDGLWEMLHNPADISAIIRESASVHAACQELVAAANAAGGEDNIGVVLVRVHDA
jgi:serine/threonine protein phosphatase PrpC